MRLILFQYQTEQHRRQTATKQKISQMRAALPRDATYASTCKRMERSLGLYEGTVSSGDNAH